MNGQDSMTKCVACLQLIPAGATICSVCKSYQRPWKNSLQYFSGIAALVLLIASAFTWLVGNGRAAFWQRDDVSLVSASTLTSAVVANRGDRDVFVSNLIFTMPGRTADWLAPTVAFDEKISPGQFLRREFSKPRLDGGEFIKGSNQIDFDEMIKKAANGDRCLELTFFERSDYLLAQLMQMSGGSLNTFDVGGYLQYWTVGSLSASYLPIKGVGAVRRCLTSPK